MQPPHPTRHNNARFALRVAWLLFKGFCFLFILLLAAAVGSFYYLPHLVNGETTKGLLADKLGQVLHRPVRIDRLILTPQGIKLKGIHIADAGGQSLLDGDSALVTIKLPALLDRRLEVSHVRVNQPRIRLSRGADGHWNIADLFVSSQTAPAPAPGRFPLTVGLSADRTTIEDGVVDVDDKLKRRHFDVSRLNLTVRRFDVKSPFEFDLSLRSKGALKDKPVEGSLSAQGVVSLAGFDWASAFLRADRLEVSAGGKTLRGSAAVAGFVQPSVDADLSLPALGPEDWPTWLGRPLDLKIPAGRLSAHVEWPQPRFLRVTKLRFAAPGLAASASGAIDLTGAEPKADADLSLDQFPLESAASYRSSLARLGLVGALTGQASVTAVPEHLSVHQVRLSARGLKAAFPHASVEGGDVDVTAEDDFSRWTVEADRGAVRAFGSLFDEVGLSLSLAKEDLRVSRLALRWGDSRMRLKGEVKRVSDPKEVAISGHIDRVRWERAQALVENVVASFSTGTYKTAAQAEVAAPRKTWVRIFKYAIPRHFPDTIGHISIGETTHKNFSFRKTDVMWDLQGVTPTLRRVSGDVRVGFGPGRVNDIQAVQSANKFLTIVFLPYIYMHKMNSLSVLSAATAYPTSLDFNRIEGQYGVRKGVVSTRFFHVDSPQLVAYADGTADFGRELVDMNILTRLNSYRAPLPEWWVDEAGRPAIGFRVKGDLSQPELEPRLTKMHSDEIENALSAARGRAKQRFDAIEKLETLEAAK